MDDATNPATEVEFESQVTSEAVTDENVVVDESLPPDDIGDESSEVAEDFDDVEYEGKQYKLPKELKEALLRQADYTKKTQEVAEQRRAFETERQRVAQEIQLQQQTIEKHAEMVAIDQQLRQFQNVDWNTLSDQDPVQAQKLWFQYQQLQGARGQLATQVEQARMHTIQSQQAELARRVEEGKAILAREIPNWSPEVAKTITEYGKKSGYSDQELGSLVDPRMVKTLHKAYLYDQLTAKAQTKPKSVPQEPVPVVKAKSAAATKDPDKMSTDEWMKWRNSQVKRRA